MGLFGAAIGSAIAAAVNAAKSQNKRTAGGSSYSSPNSEASAYHPIGSNTDESINQSNPADYNRIQAYKEAYAQAMRSGDIVGATSAHNAANAIRRQYGYTGGKDGSEYKAVSHIGWGNNNYNSSSRGYASSPRDTGLYGTSIGTLNNGYDEYRRAMQEAAERERQAKQAAIDRNINQLEFQKDGVRKAGTDANTAAEQAYMNLIDKNGANAEALAARGLSASGLSESALMSAGNAYQNALGANKRSVNEQLQKIDRDIANTRLTGNIATSDAMAAYQKAVAQQGLTNAQSIAALQKQGVSDGTQLGLTIAGMTGRLNGEQTLSGKQREANLESTQIENQIRQLKARILSATGMTQAQLELEAQRLQNQGISARNAYQLLQDKYTRRQIGG